MVCRNLVWFVIIWYAWFVVIWFGFVIIWNGLSPFGMVCRNLVRVSHNLGWFVVIWYGLTIFGMAWNGSM